MPKGSRASTNARREEIISACASLYETMSFKDITLGEIGKLTTFSRPSIYNYFQTKEEIFLALHQKEYELWTADLERIAESNKKLTARQLSRELAHSLEKRERLLKLMSMNHYDMEANSRLERLTEFKRAYGNSMKAIVRCLEKFCPQMTAKDKQDFVYAFFPFVYGIYPYTAVTDKQREAMRTAGVEYAYPSIYELVYICAKKLLDNKESETLTKDGTIPDPNKQFPIPGCETVTYVKPTIRNPNIIVGDFTYFGDVDFESHVTHHYDFNGDKLIIGKFCQIAKGVEFVMNGANHQMNAVSTFPFYIMEGWEQETPRTVDMPLKGDTVIGNDVWIGQNATILPGVHIGDGAIIGMDSVVGSDVAPYAVVVGNPAREIRKRFDDELIQIMLRLRWWDKSVEEINGLIAILTCGDLDKVKRELTEMLTK